MSHILDVPGLSVGHAENSDARTGTTVVVANEPSVAAISVHGGAPGTRESDALRPHGLGPPVDAIVLSGGSAFGLAAGDGAQRALLAQGRGYALGPHRVPIVPAAIVFDLSGPPPDYAALGHEAVMNAGDDRREGTVGAGVGATTARLKGGVGSASERIGPDDDPITVGALVVVNALGAVTAANGPWFRAAPFERGREFGGLSAPPDADFASVGTKLSPAVGENTTIAVVATDATLTRPQAYHMAVAAHDGLALAIYPSHTILDGDTVFGLSTARRGHPASLAEHVALTAAAARALARATARAVYAATARPGDRKPTWSEAFPGSVPR